MVKSVAPFSEMSLISHWELYWISFHKPRNKHCNQINKQNDGSWFNALNIDVRWPKILCGTQRLTDGTHQQPVIIFLAGSERTSQSHRSLLTSLGLHNVAALRRILLPIPRCVTFISRKFGMHILCTPFFCNFLRWSPPFEISSNPTVDELQHGHTCLLESVQQWQIWRTNIAALATKIYRLAVSELCQTHFSRSSQFTNPSRKYNCTWELRLHDILDYRWNNASHLESGWVESTTFHVSVQRVVAEIIFMSCNNEVYLYLVLTGSNFQSDKHLGRQLILSPRGAHSCL